MADSRTLPVPPASFDWMCMKVVPLNTLLGRLLSTCYRVHVIVGRENTAGV